MAAAEELVSEHEICFVHRSELAAHCVWVLNAVETVVLPDGSR